jgi:hypothetical protein
MAKPYEPAPTPPCGMWLMPDTVCCETAPANPCAPTQAPATCAVSTDEDLIRYATTLLNQAAGWRYPGWCCAVDELCHRRPECDCPATRRCHDPMCCERDTLWFSDLSWPIHSVTEVRLDDPFNGMVIPASNYFWTDGGRLDHTGDGWPTCRRIYVHYKHGGIPMGGPEACLRLVCVLRKLWAPTTGHCAPKLKPEDNERSILGLDPAVDVWVAGLEKYDPKPATILWRPSDWKRRTIRVSC